MGQRETLSLDEVDGARVREAVQGNTRMEGLLHSIGFRRIVGLVVEDDKPEAASEEPAVEPVAEVTVETAPAPKAKGKKKAQPSAE